TVWLPLAVSFCLAGMACKEVMVTAPVLILMFEWTFVGDTLRGIWARSWRLYAGLASTWLLLIVLNYNAPRALAGFHYGVPGHVWWLTQTKVLMMYLKLAIWPSPLFIHYRIPYLTTVAAAAPFLVPVLLMGVAAVWLLFHRRALGFVGACVF